MAIISVIVPVYNVEKYLPQCVDSVLSQTFSDFELILVDDGSPDKCGAICDEYARHDERVRVIHQKNGGLSAARNAGILAAQGRYITFVDSDDYIDADYCRYMYGMLSETNCDFAACALVRFRDGEPIVQSAAADPEVQPLSNLVYLDRQMSTGFSACGKLYRREVFASHMFRTGRLHEDILFCCDIARDLRNGVCCTDAALYLYRQNDTGIMANSKKRCSPDRVYAGAYLYDTVKELCPELAEKALAYAVKYPWSLVDGIYVDRAFRENKAFLDELRTFLRKHKGEITSCETLESIVRRRMVLFADSPVMYGVNAYGRLSRVYLYRLIGKDAYRGGHGI